MKSKLANMFRSNLNLNGIIVVFFLFAFYVDASAQSACSNVALEILQEATTERVAFDAKLVLTNNIPDKDLSGLRVDVSIKDKDGNIRDDLFFMRTSSLKNITGVDGTGTVSAGSSAEVHWLIIPSVGAGGQISTGIDYWVGASLVYTINGKQEIVSVKPDKITVKPMPQLVLDYFMPRQVIADDPFTSQVEAPVPFMLGLRVLNNGAGTATKLKIDSAQPKIISNDQGLLVDFKLLGASVDDHAISPSLTVNIGDLGSKKIATADWEMISTLKGTFTGFDVSFSHSSELGGELTSLITATNAYYLVHKIKVNLPGRDNVLDFLADTDRDSEHLPDTIFESEIPDGSTDSDLSRSPISRAALISQPARPTPESPNVSIQISPNSTGWIFAKFDDPSAGMLQLLDVVRGDGVHLDPNNFWIEENFDSNFQKTFTTWLVDYRADASVPAQYNLAFTQPAADNFPPATRINFDGPSVGNNPFYITPATKIFFTASDNAGGSGVNQILKKIAGQDSNFVPAYPFSISNTGTYTVDYYSTDRAGNTEPTNTNTIIVKNSAPVINSFQAVPNSFTPYAPKGIEAVRETKFIASISDAVSALPITIDIARSNEFTSSTIIKTLAGTASPDSEFTLSWDGKNSSGTQAPTGTYYARMTVTDGLSGFPGSHASSAVTTVSLADWFSGTPLDPDLSGAQMYPSVSGTNAVWQDNRSGNWKIFTINLSGGQSRALSPNGSDQQRPRIDGNTVVWQDRRNGNWDMFGFDLSTNQEFVIANGIGDQEKPAISGEWVAWQDNANGNWDIYAKNISTNEIIRITNHERDQINPSIAGNSIYWEDYRHGLGEIYKFDLISRAETRITINTANQTEPDVSGPMVAWTDQRNLDDGKDIYIFNPEKGETRLTYGSWDESHPYLLNNKLVYVDNENGPENPDLSFYDLESGVGGKLTAHPAKQEEPTLNSAYVFWQDDRDGIYQIYKAAFNIVPTPITVELKQGLNLVAVGDKLVHDFPNASDLLNANMDIDKIMVFNSLHGVYSEASRSGGDFALSKGSAILIYMNKAGSIQTAESGEAAQYTLLQGENHIGLLSVPASYTAYSFINALGTDNIKGVRRFDAATGLWQTVSVRDNAGIKEIVGTNFNISAGDGLIINMLNRVDGWQP